MKTKNNDGLSSVSAYSKQNASRPTRVFNTAGLALAGTALLGMTVAFSTAGIPVTTASADDAQATPQEQGQSTTSSLAYSSGKAATQKSETVYVFQKADGSVKNQTVSNSLTNGNGAQLLQDQTDLTDIENVEGDQEFTQSSEGTVWDAKGGDISYRGTTTKEAPVDIKVSYQLDGKDVTPDEISGKTGHVKIHIAYTNNSKQTVDGQTVYTPFLAMTGLILDNDNFTNVTTDNAKVIDDGDRHLIAGYAMPGLKESLGLDDLIDLDIPSSVDIEADATDFSLDSMLTLVSSGFFGDVDVDNLNAGNIQDQLNQMQDAMNQLIDGGATLTDGLQQLSTGAKAVDDGAQQLSAGSGKLVDGSQSLAEGTAQVSAGAEQLSQGMSDTSGIGQLVGGVSSLKNGLVGLKNGTSQAATGSKAVSSGLQKAIQAVGVAQQGAKGVGDAASQSATLSNKASNGLDQVISGLSAQAAALPEGDQKTQLETTVATLKEIKQATDGAAQYSQGAADGATKLSEGLTDLNGDANAGTGLSYAAAATEQIAEGLDTATGAIGTETDASSKTLLGGANLLQGGLGTMTDKLQEAGDGAAALSTGAKQVNDGAAALNVGAVQLDAGIGTLAANTPALASGAQQAADGSVQLSDGLQQFNEQAVQKIVDAFSGNLGSLADKTKAIVQAGKNYNNFCGITSGTEGHVKFIYETDAINKD